MRMRFLVSAVCALSTLAVADGEDSFSNYRNGLDKDVWFLGYSSYAPWVKDYRHAGKDETKLVAGVSRIVFGKARLEAPDPIGCAAPKYEFKIVNAAQLFGGKLTKPDEDAKDLGFDKDIVMLDAGCQTKFYFVDPYKAFFTAKDRIYGVEREPPSGSPRQDDRERMQKCLGLVTANRKARGAHIEPFLEEEPTAAGRLESVSRQARYLDSSCIGAIAYPCIAKRDDDSTRIACYDRERAFWDERLNANYKRAVSKAEPAVAANYKKIERAWLALRDARCSHPQIEFQGSMAGPMAASCLMEMTAEQALWLDAEE